MTFNKISYFNCLRGMDFDRNVGAVRVLMALYCYSDAAGRNARPGVERLADDCCMSQSTVKKHLKLLTDMGFIEQECRGGRSRDGRRWASSYRLRIPGSTSEPPAVDVSTSEPPAVDVSTSEPPDVERGYQQPRKGLSTAEEGLSTSEPPAPIKSLTTSHFQQVTEGGVSNAREVALPGDTPTPPTPIHLPSMEEPELGGIVPPSRFCAKHHPYGTDDPCHGCARARKYRDQSWPYTDAGYEYTKAQATVSTMAKNQGRKDAKFAPLAKTAGISIDEMKARAIKAMGADLSGADLKATEWMALGRKRTQPQPIASQRLPDAQPLDVEPITPCRGNASGRGHLSASATPSSNGVVLEPVPVGRTRQQQTAGLEALMRSDPARWGAL